MTWLASILAFLFLKLGFAFQAYNIPSASMNPTLIPGDYVWSGRAPFSAPYRRGDVIVFSHRDLSNPRDTVFVKRIVALPGEHVALRAGVVIIDGTPATLRPDGTDVTADPPAQRFVEVLPGGTPHLIRKMTALGTANNTPETIVPPGQVFVLGDNRDNSFDSRFVQFGPVPITDILGSPSLIYWSRDRSRILHPVE